MKSMINVDVKPKGIFSAYVVAPFDEGKEELEKAGYSIVSLQENAGLRMQERAKEDVSLNGNWVREGVIYVPQKGIYLTKSSPIMANAKIATDCHRKGTEFYLTDEQVEEALTDFVKLSPNAIPTNSFGENEIAVYAFGEDAENYGKFLNEAGIEEMPVWLANVQDKPFARQMWLFGLGGGRSGLGGDSGSLGNGDGVRGVKNSAEGTAKNLEGKL